MNPFQTVLIAGCWRTGSTVLNLSLIQHPSIFGWTKEAAFFQQRRSMAAQVDEVTPAATARIVQEQFAQFCTQSGRRHESCIRIRKTRGSSRTSLGGVVPLVSFCLLVIPTPSAIQFWIGAAAYRGHARTCEDITSPCWHWRLCDRSFSIVFAMKALVIWGAGDPKVPILGRGSRGAQTLGALGYPGTSGVTSLPNAGGYSRR
jgi:hypothetical protein